MNSATWMLNKVNPRRYMRLSKSDSLRCWCHWNCLQEHLRVGGNWSFENVCGCWNQSSLTWCFWNNFSVYSSAKWRLLSPPRHTFCCSFVRNITNLISVHSNSRTTINVSFGWNITTLFNWFCQSFGQQSRNMIIASQQHQKQQFLFVCLFSIPLK